jgi:hypothetical protein
MREQDKKPSDRSFSAAKLKRLRRQYEQLQQQIADLPWILQGSVTEKPPLSATARATYQWTRKVRAKTVSIALSPEQATAFRDAIAANRRLEDALRQMRKLSQTVLLHSLPKAKRRSSKAPKKPGADSS